MPVHLIDIKEPILLIVPNNKLNLAITQFSFSHKQAFAQDLSCLSLWQVRLRKFLQISYVFHQNWHIFSNHLYFHKEWHVRIQTCAKDCSQESKFMKFKRQNVKVFGTNTYVFDFQINVLLFKMWLKPTLKMVFRGFVLVLDFFI